MLLVIHVAKCFVILKAIICKLFVARYAKEGTESAPWLIQPIALVEMSICVSVCLFVCL